MRFLLVFIVGISFHSFAQNAAGLKVWVNRFDMYSLGFYEVESKEKHHFEVGVGTGVKSLVGTRTVQPCVQLGYNRYTSIGQSSYWMLGAYSFSALLPVGSNTTFFNDFGVQTGFKFGELIQYHVKVGCGLG